MIEKAELQSKLSQLYNKIITDSFQTSSQYLSADYKSALIHNIQYVTKHFISNITDKIHSLQKDLSNQKQQRISLKGEYTQKLTELELEKQDLLQKISNYDKNKTEIQLYIKQNSQKYRVQVNPSKQSLLDMLLSINKTIQTQTDAYKQKIKILHDDIYLLQADFHYQKQKVYVLQQSFISQQQKTLKYKQDLKNLMQIVEQRNLIVRKQQQAKQKLMETNNYLQEELQVMKQLFKQSQQFYNKYELMKQKFVNEKQTFITSETATQTQFIVKDPLRCNLQQNQQELAKQSNQDQQEQHKNPHKHSSDSKTSKSIIENSKRQQQYYKINQQYQKQITLKQQLITQLSKQLTHQKQLNKNHEQSSNISLHQQKNHYQELLNYLSAQNQALQDKILELKHQKHQLQQQIYQIKSQKEQNLKSFKIQINNQKQLLKNQQQKQQQKQNNLNQQIEQLLQKEQKMAQEIKKVKYEKDRYFDKYHSQIKKSKQHQRSIRKVKLMVHLLIQEKQYLLKWVTKQMKDFWEDTKETVNNFYRNLLMIQMANINNINLDNSPKILQNIDDKKELSKLKINKKYLNKQMIANLNYQAHILSATNKKFMNKNDNQKGKVLLQNNGKYLQQTN